MNYNYLDCEYFMSKAPYMRLMKSGVGLSFISQEIEKIHGFATCIAEYPTVKYEPLDFLYQCHECLCALDKMLFEDFVVHFNWRGIVWASWLAAITPRPQSYMTELLESQRDAAPQNVWVVNLALKSLSNTVDEADRALSIAREYKNYLSLLPYKKLPLRKWYPETHLKLQELRRQKVLEIYKSQGTDATLHYIQTNSKTEFDLEYKEWLRTQDKT